MLKQLAFKLLPSSLLRIFRATHYQRVIRQARLEDERDLVGCSKLIHSGQTIVDVGANIGIYTRFFSQFVGPSGKVISLEPVPETYSYLNRNVLSLGLRNVTCHNMAASHRTGSSAMSIPQYATGGLNLYEASLTSDGEIPVKLMKLDELLRAEKPAFIKCDVEGHEISVLNGAAETIQKHLPKWLVEVSRPETFSAFIKAGYKAFWFDGNQFVAYDGEQKTSNYYFLTEAPEAEADSGAPRYKSS